MTIKQIQALLNGYKSRAGAETVVLINEAIKSLDNVRENVRGEWIFPYGDKKYKKCSTCGRTYYSIPHTSNYCPNCGADMRGDKT